MNASPLSPLFGALLIALLLLPAIPVWGYRPFVSTDAAVADPNAFEIELGYFNWQREIREETLTVPNLVINYGIFPNLELVGEFAIEEPRHERVQLVDPALSVKAVLREGILQEKTGPSFAIEAGALLPSTRKSENRLGFQGAAILSGRAAGLTYHLNLGGGVDRARNHPFMIWGVIAEVPVTEKLRLAGEINGENAKANGAGNSALLGFIWNSPLPNVAVDGAVRRGISRAAADWIVTTGVTFSFSLANQPHK
jgi:hypothetical protein